MAKSKKPSSSKGKPNKPAKARSEKSGRPPSVKERVMAQSKVKGSSEDKPNDPAKSEGVGYGRPPQATRFKPGQSGNPKGRPKNSKNFRTLLVEAFTEKITLQEGNTTRRISKLEGVVRRQVQNALKGEDKSALAVLKMAAQFGLLDDKSAGPAETDAVSAAEMDIIDAILAQRKVH